MKKMLAAILLVCLLFTLTGCGNSEPKLNDNGKRWIPDEADQQVVLEMFAELKEIFSEKPTVVNASEFAERIDEAVEDSGASDILDDAGWRRLAEGDDADTVDAELPYVDLFYSQVCMGLSSKGSHPEEYEEYYYEVCEHAATLADTLLKNKNYFKGCPGFEDIY